MRKRKKRFYVILAILIIVFVISSFCFGKEFFHRRKAQELFESLAERISVQQPEEGRDIRGLQTQNPECIGWIHIADSKIDYPVMHTPEEPEKYLHLDFMGEYSYPGVPFLDYRCSIQSDNLIIYGHNMRNGTMFADLNNYLDDAWRNTHRTIEFETADGCFCYTVTDVRNVHKTDDWYDGLKTENGRKYITLSTCYETAENDRLIVIAEKN